MLDLLLLLVAPLAAALLGVSYAVLSCCKLPPSSRLSVNQSSMDQGRDTGLEQGETIGRGSRKLVIVDVENINADVKEKTIEDEKKEAKRKAAQGGREKLNRPRAKKSTAQRSEQRDVKKDKLKKKSRARESKGKEANNNSKSSSDKKSDIKKNDKKRSAEIEKTNTDVLLNSSDPTSMAGNSKLKSNNNNGDKIVKDAADDSNKDGGSMYVVEAQQTKTGIPLAPVPAASNERVGTNETMGSRDRADEIDSAKNKRLDGLSARTPVARNNNNNFEGTGGLSAADTQMDSEAVKKPSPKRKSPPKPKRKLTKKKEEEVRQHNDAIARGNLFRKRVDDETIDEVQVDWNS